MARALPTIVWPLVSERNADQMRADADDDQPFRLWRPLLIGLRILELAERRIDRLLDLLLRAMSDEHWAAAPLDRHDLTFRDRAGIHFDRSQSQRRSVGIHLIDQWPDHSRRTHGGHRASGQEKEIPAVWILDGQRRQMNPRSVRR